MMRFKPVAASVLMLALRIPAQDRGMAVKPTDLGLEAYNPARFHALVIGIDRYAQWQPLRSAVRDARAVAEVLASDYGFGEVTLLLDEDATRRGILAALDKLLALDEDRSILVYYAGHGWMDEANNGYWVPVEAARDDKFAYVSNAQIASEYFRKYRAKHLLVVSDSCFSGSLLHGGDPVRPADWKLPAGFQKPSRYVMTSGDLAPVSDDAGGGHSPFAERLLQYLRYGDAPAFGVQDLYVYVRKTLPGQPLCQPLDTSKHMPGGEFVFCRVGKGARVASVPLMPTPVVPTPERVQPQESLADVRDRSAGETQTVDLGGGVRLELTWCPPGSFTMGSPADEAGRSDDEKQHRVTLSKGFWLGKYEVTQAQWEAVMGSTPSHFKNAGRTAPVESVSWDDCQEFCRKLTDLEQAAGSLPAGMAYRLPTEAEWEYAARGATKSRGYTHSGGNDLAAGVWCGNNSRSTTHPVGKNAANELGLHDMSGNVQEWCFDWYQDSYAGLATSDPTGPANGSSRVCRGGSWASGIYSDCRTASRDWAPQSSVNSGCGFRVVLAPVP